MLKNLLKLIPIVLLFVMIVPQNSIAQSSAEQLIKAYESGQLNNLTVQEKQKINQYLQSLQKGKAHREIQFYSPEATILTENFDAVTPPALPTDWTSENTNGDGVEWVSSTYSPNSNPNSMRISYNSSLAMDDYFFSPGLSLTGGVEYRVRFQYKSGGFDESMEVLWGDSPSSSGMNGGQIFDNPDFTNGTYTEGSGTFTPTTTGTYYIGWHGYSSADQYYICVDDVIIDEAPSGPPDAAVLLSPADGSTDISNPILEWMSGGGAAETGYKIKFGTTNPPTAETDLGLVTTYSPAGLSYSTTYYWQIIAYNGSGDGTASEIWSFTTGPDPTVTTFPYNEGFEGTNFPPYGWANNSWDWSLYGGAHTGTKWAYSNTSGSQLTTLPISLGSNLQLSYWYRVESSSYPQDMDVLLSTDGINFTTTLASYTGVINSAYAQEVIDLSAYAGETVYIRFNGLTGAGGFDYGICVDDVTVEEIPAPGIYPPTNLQATVTGQDVDLSWLAPGADQFLRYDNGVNADAIGLTAGGTFEAAARFPSSIMMPFVGKELTDVEIYILDVPSSCVIKIYDEGTASAPGALLYSEDVTSSIVGSSFNDITLASPVAINGNDLWISYEVTHAAGEHPAGIDPGPANPDGEWIYVDPDWGALGFDANWNIAGYIATPAPNGIQRTKDICPQFVKG